MRTKHLLQCSPAMPLLILSLTSFSLIGCQSEEGRFEISGKVTYEGQPVPDGTIGFIHNEMASENSVGTEITDGVYRIPRDQGPREGSYTVLIDGERPSGRKIQADEGSNEMIDEMEQYIPAIYNSRSTLKIEIAGDRVDLDFDLQKPPKSKRRFR